MIELQVTQEETTKNYNNKKRKEQDLNIELENLSEKLQNLEYKFDKLEEFTEQKNVNEINCGLTWVQFGNFLPKIGLEVTLNRNSLLVF